MRLFWGIAVTGIGVLLLGINFNWWSSSILLNVLYFWPVILIIIGLRFIVKDDNVFLIMVLAILAIVGFLVSQNPNKTFLNIRKGELHSESVNEKADSAIKRVNFTLNTGASKVFVKALSESDSKDSQFKVDTKNYGKLDVKSTTTNSVKTIKVGEEPEINVMPFGVNSSREITCSLAQNVPLDVTINGGAGDFDLDFTSLKLENLQISSGATKTKLTFGKNVDLLTAKLDTGASSAEIFLPKGVGLKVKYNVNGLNTRDFAPGLGLTKDGEIYTNSDYATAKQKIELTISAGVSSILLRQY